MNSNSDDKSYNLSNKLRELIAKNPIFSFMALMLFVGSLPILYRFRNDPIPIVLSLFAIFITVGIAMVQRKTFVEIIDIGKNTQATAENIRSDRISGQRTRKYFQISSRKKANVALIYPHKYLDRPLPSVSTGDYYALLVLDRRLGENNTEFYGFIDETDISEEVLKQERVVLICAHLANPVIKQCCEVLEIKPEDNLEGISLAFPCWFADDFRDDQRRKNDDRDDPVRKIIVNSGNGPPILIESPCEDSYIELEKSIKSKKHGPIQDFGIFARITTPDTDSKSKKTKKSRKFIVAGIHQYGTWIVADFMDKILSGKERRYDDVLLNDKDFIAIVRGEFDANKLHVNEAMILNNYIWQKNSDTWVRFRETMSE